MRSQHKPPLHILRLRCERGGEGFGSGAGADERAGVARIGHPRGAAAGEKEAHEPAALLAGAAAVPLQHHAVTVNPVRELHAASSLSPSSVADASPIWTPSGLTVKFSVVTRVMPNSASCSSLQRSSASMLSSTLRRRYFLRPPPRAIRRMHAASSAHSSLV